MAHQVQRGSIWRHTWRLARGDLRGSSVWLTVMLGGKVVSSVKAHTGSIVIDHAASTATVSFDTQPLPPGTYDAHFHLWLADGTRASEPPEKLIIV